MRLTFRCLPGFEDVLPKPIPARKGLPEWLKDMPATAMSETLGGLQSQIGQGLVQRAHAARGIIDDIAQISQRLADH